VGLGKAVKKLSVSPREALCPGGDRHGATAQNDTERKVVKQGASLPVEEKNQGFFGRMRKRKKEKISPRKGPSLKSRLRESRGSERAEAVRAEKLLM